MRKGLVLAIVALIGIVAPAHGQIPLASGTYATHFTNFETKVIAGRLSQLQSAEVGRLILTPTSDIGGTASWRSNGMYESKFGARVCLSRFNGSYTEDKFGNLFLFQDDGTCTPVHCGGLGPNANCAEETPVVEHHREWLYCLDEVVWIDCMQAGAYDPMGPATPDDPKPGWQRPAEQERWDKLSPLGAE